MTSETELELFEAVVDSISSDRFVAFMQRYVADLAAPSSAKYLPWIHDDEDEDEDDDGNDYDRGCAKQQDACHSTSLDGALRRSSVHASGAGAALREYSASHFEAFATYKMFFESKLRVSLRRFGPQWTDERFFGLCESVLAAEKDRPDAQQRDGTLRATSRELCTSLLQMLESASEFQSFCEMMARVQTSLLERDDDEDAA
jgi:hypothetical protein